MEEQETQSSRGWKAQRDKVRLSSAQRYRGLHEKEIRSPISPARRRDTNLASGRRSTVSVTERNGSIGGRDTVLGVVTDGLSGTHEATDVERNPLKAMESWAKRPTKWGEKRALCDETPQMSPSTLLPGGYEKDPRRASRIPRWPGSLVKSRTLNPDLPVVSAVNVKPDLDSVPQSSHSERFESTHGNESPRPSVTNVPNEGDARRGSVEQMEKYAEGISPLENLSRHRDSGNVTWLQFPDSKDAISDDDQDIKKDIGNGPERDYDVLPQPPMQDQSTDETGEGEIQAVSDMGQKPDQNGTSSKTPDSPHRNECDSLSWQLQPAITAPTLVHASSIHDPIKGQFDPEINIDKKVPDTPHSTGTMEDQDYHSHAKSTKSDTIKSPNSQPKPAGGDHKNHRNSQAHSSECGRVTVKTSQTQNEVREDLDEEAWLKSDVPLQENYRAMFGGPISPTSSSSDWGSNQEGSTDSLIVSPARTDESDSEDEDNLNAADADADIMKMFEEYKAKFSLEPSFEEEEEDAEDDGGAKAATDRPKEKSRGWNPYGSSTSNIGSNGFLPSFPDHNNNESPTESKASHDDLRNAEEEDERNQATLNLIELYRENFQLKKDLKEREDKHKREIEIAQKQPRPLPSTQEQRLDALALEEIRSMDIFDELGEQQRPIHTSPQMVLFETHVGYMLTRAQLNYILERYRKMYIHADRAVEASKQLQFPPLTARCCYYRGMAFYYTRDFQLAKRDFLDSRGCAGLYGIMSEHIERYIDLIDNAHDPETAVLEFFPAPKFGRKSKARRTTTPPYPEADNENEPSPSTLIEGSSTAPQDMVSQSPPFSFPNGKEHSARQPGEDANSPIQTLRRPSHLRGLSPDGDPQPGAASPPNYQPRETAISEDIRKEIFESKARSLGGPTEADSPEGETSPPISMASTERTLLGSVTSQGTPRHVPRPHIAPIITSIAETPVRQASPERTLVAGSADEMDEDNIYAQFGGRPRLGMPLDDEITPVEVQRRPWARSDQATIRKANEAFRNNEEDQ